MKSNEKSILKIFFRDVEKEKVMLLKKFSSRARKLRDSKAISKENYDTICTILKQGANL